MRGRVPPRFEDSTTRRDALYSAIQDVARIAPRKGAIERLGSSDCIRYAVGVVDSGKNGLIFTLRYKGPLSANGSPKQKHAIRRLLHPQLRTLWQEEPLLKGTTTTLMLGQHEDKWVKATRVDWISLDHQIGSFRFVPLVSKNLELLCSLEIDFYRREPPGHVVQGGDIDNRLKTLFDALRVPSAHEVENMSPGIDEEPFFCLMEDDALIQGFCIETKRLLEPLSDGEAASHIALTIQVNVTTTLASGELAFRKLGPA